MMMRPLCCRCWTKEEEERARVQNWMGLRDRGQPGGVSLCQAADAGMKLKPSPTPAGGIPAGSCPVGAVQKWVRMLGCKCHPWRQSLLLCQMGASLPAQAWGFPQSCWDPHGLGESCHLLRVWAAGWLRLGVPGLSLTCAFPVGIGRSGSYILPGNPLMPMFPTQSLQSPPSRSAFSVG